MQDSSIRIEFGPGIPGGSPARRTGRPAVALLLLSLLFLGAPVRAQDPPPGSVEVLTLEQAVALAAQANRQVATARLELDKAEEQIAAAKTHRLPVFSLSVLGSQRLVPMTFEFSHATDPDGNPLPTADNTYTVDPQFMTIIKAQAAQPISQLYQIGLGIQQAEVNRDIAREQLRQENQAVADSVKATFYQLLQIQSALDAIQDEIRFYAEFERLVGEFVKQQTALPAELMDIQTRLAQSRFDADKLADNLATQKEALNDLMGRDIRTEFRVEPIPEPAPLEAELEPARARALEQRPEMREARMRVQLAELDRRIKKADYIPQVYVSMDYSSTINLEFLPRNMWSLGVLLQWDIYDWGRKKHELGQKMMAEKQAVEALRETESQVLRDVGDKFRKLRQARAQVGVCRLSETAAREKLRNTRDNYAQQAALLKDVLQAQSSLSDAEDKYRQAVLEIWTAKADFEKAMGEE